MNSIKSIIGKLVQLSSFKLGILITILFCFIARDYYLYRTSDQSNIAGLQTFLQQLHLKSIDYRMQFRGDRQGSKDIAILTIDEDAIHRIGRWPFPREVFADVIQSSMELGAKLIAFDIIFSEENITDTSRVLERLKAQNFKDPSIYKAIEAEAERANTDKPLTAAIEKYKDNLIMGAFYEPASYVIQGANESCANLIYNNSPQYTFIQNQELAVATTDIPPLMIPQAILSFLEVELGRIALLAASQSQGLSEKQRERFILNQQLEYCAKWLHPSEDKSLVRLKNYVANWLPESKDFTSLGVEEFIDIMRYRFTTSRIIKAEYLTTNIEEYNQASAHFGFFNALIDRDGTIRKSNLLARYGDAHFASLALKTYMRLKQSAVVFTEQKDPVVSHLSGVKDFQLIDLESGEVSENLSLDLNASLRINYAGPQKMFPHLSLAEFFNNKETAVIETRHNGEAKKFTINKKDWFKDKIFIVGATATGVYDLRVSPFEENFPGVETHANVLDNLIRGDFLKDFPNEVEYMFYFLFILGLLLSLSIAKLGAIPSSIFTFLAMILIIYLDFTFLYAKGIVMNIVLPTLMIVCLYIGLTIYKYFTEEKNKRVLKSTFQKYVSPAIVEEVLKDAKNIELGGKKVCMSVLFSDIRGFTTISEQLSPNDLSDFLNSYLTPMTDLVFKNKGTLDKYMGDAVMAFFGAPIAYKDHAKMACQCALDMMETLKKLKKIYASQNLPIIEIGIGINTGDMSVGNMGSETIRSYTVIGDAVNLGSRLESINKEYGTNIIISEFTYNDVSEHFFTREIDRVQVKGKTEPVKIYELIGSKKSYKNEQKLKVVAHFEEAYRLYRQRNFTEAILVFEKALALDSTDGPSRLFKERSAAFLQEPPPNNWDGVFAMKTK